MNNYNKSKNYDILANMVYTELLTSEQLLDIFVNWYGRESLTIEFMEYVNNEIKFMKFIKDELGY